MHSLHQHQHQHQHLPQHRHHHPALEVPEILHRIGEYLSRGDLVTSFRVCSTFHSILAPLLYRDLDLDFGPAVGNTYSPNYGYGRRDSSSSSGSGSGSSTLGLNEENGENNDSATSRRERRRPSPTVLRDRYAPLVRRVKFENSIVAEYLSVGFAHLTSVTLSCNDDRTRTGAGGRGAAGGGGSSKRRKMRNPIGEEEEEDDEDERKEVENANALVRLVQNNKELVSWTIEKFRTRRFSAKVWQAIVEVAQGRVEKRDSQHGGGRRMSTATAAGLEMLVVKQVTIDKESAPWFVRACRLAKVLRLVVVDLTHCNLFCAQDPVPTLSLPSPPPSPPHRLQRQEQQHDEGILTPPMAQNIYMWSVQGCSFMDQLRFLVDCSQARSIAWSSPFAQWRQDLFHLSLKDLDLLINPDHPQHSQQPQQRTLWPHIQSLRFSEWLRGRIEPEEMAVLGTYIARLLDYVPNQQIRFFRLSGSKMHAMSTIPTLRQHHNLSLNHVRLRGCPSVSSTMVQELLESCPNLTTLTANTLCIDAISRGRPWICKGLVEFQMFLDLSLDFEALILTDRNLEAHRLVFQRLSTLPALERLMISRIPVRVKVSHPKLMIASDLRLQLSYGMDALSTLKRLKVLNFVDVDQSFNKETIQWMISSWPRLGSVQGMLAPSLERNATLATILTNHGIHYSCA